MLQPNYKLAPPSDLFGFRSMKSTEVYKVLRERLAPTAKALGFRRTSGGMLGWYKALDGQNLVFWFQCSQTGWDPFTGSQFTLEFQRSPSSGPGDGVDRARFPKLLDSSDLEKARQIQNEVIVALQKPLRGHWSEQLQGDSQKWYQRQFWPVKEPFTSSQDLWIRYASPAHVALSGRLP